MVLVLLLLFLHELYVQRFGGKPSPWTFLLLALAIAALGTYRIWRLRPRMRDMIQGVRGEQRVGQSLEELRLDGYSVFHALDPDEGGNIDHVLIGPAGVFALDTKTLSIPADRAARIVYDGTRLRIDGKDSADFGDRRPLDQAQGEAAALARMLLSCTGEDVPVQPVLLYPGWWVEECPDAPV
jgi:hypothetical protein